MNTYCLVGWLKMKEVKIDVVDWLGEFEDNFFIQFLSKKYQIVRSSKPDYLLCSVFGKEYRKYSDCVKIFFTGENVVPDFNEYDYAMGFHHIDFEDRYLRFPLFLLYTNALNLAKNKHIFSEREMDNLFKRDFCSFVVSNSFGDRIRENFFKKLFKHKHIASGGRFMNNIGSCVKNKHDFISQYKFNIAFENYSQSGYCTEKLIEAFAARTIPIYWGDPNFSEQSKIKGKNEEVISFINKKAFIDVSDFSSLSEAIDFILEVNQNKQKYEEILKEKAFLIDDVEDFYMQKLESFFDNIFSTDVHKCMRRPKLQSYWYLRRSKSSLEWLKDRVTTRIKHYLGK